MRTLLLGATLVLGCSTVVDGASPSEEGMYSDDVNIEVDGVLVQCGNLLDANYYWTVHADEAQQVHVMPVICLGSQDTPGFDLDSAEQVGEKYQFPDWELDIQARCAAGCMAAHDVDTNQAPVCGEENFAPNFAWGDWAPADGPNCDSTVLPNVQSEPGLDVNFSGPSGPRMNIKGGHS